MTNTQGTTPNPPQVNPIPPGQKAVLMSGISLLIASLEMVAQHYQGNHKVYDFLERLEEALGGAQQALMTGDYDAKV